MIAILGVILVFGGLAVGPMNLISVHHQILLIMAGILIFHLDVLFINPVARLYHWIKNNRLDSFIIHYATGLYLRIQKTRHGG
jgi:hypothetical protein